MGVLDDAIREHLDLKRRRGADPEEIERLEQEALGPVSRGPELPDALADAAGVYEPAPEAGYAESVEPDEWDDEVAQAPAASPRSYAGNGEPELAEEDEWVGEAPASTPEPRSAEADTRATPPPAPAMPSPSPEPELGGETVEYDVEADHEAERDRPRRKGEDVLEETPEFLQDTPDHDRLWFEQRPPKDFDFDG